MANADYEKVFIKGWATKKSFDWGEVVDVSINIEDLIEKVRTKEIYVGETWNVRFSVLKKKPENVRAGESDHYLVHSKKVSQPEKKNPLYSWDTDSDLPF